MGPAGAHGLYVHTGRVDGIGNWVLERSESQEWRMVRVESVGAFFCTGNPGVGKTDLRRVGGSESTDSKKS